MLKRIAKSPSRRPRKRAIRTASTRPCPSPSSYSISATSCARLESDRHGFPMHARKPTDFSGSWREKSGIMPRSIPESLALSGLTILSDKRHKTVALCQSVVKLSTAK